MTSTAWPRLALAKSSSVSGSRRCANGITTRWYATGSLHLLDDFRLRVRSGGRRVGAFQGVEQLIDQEWLVQDEAQPVLARLDDRVRGIVAVRSHQDHAR